jgi:DnaJ-class molecular chaperone
MKKIKQECDSCSGTGLYSGMCEGRGNAVVCLTCSGRGWYYHAFIEFTKRKKMRGIKEIRESRGTFIATGVGGIGKAMTYTQFEKKYPAEELK